MRDITSYIPCLYNFFLLSCHLLNHPWGPLQCHQMSSSDWHCLQLTVIKWWKRRCMGGWLGPQHQGAGDSQGAFTPFWCWQYYGEQWLQLVSCWHKLGPSLDCASMQSMSLVSKSYVKFPSGHAKGPTELLLWSWLRVRGGVMKWAW